MDSVKQIKAVAQTYLQEQQLKEQAEYISVLEHTIEVIAEELGIPPQQLINEISVMGRAASAFKAAREGGSGVLGAGIQAVKAGVGAFQANANQAAGRGLRSASPIQIPTAGNRTAGVGFMAGNLVGRGRLAVAGAQERVANRAARKTMGVSISGGADPYYDSPAADQEDRARFIKGANKQAIGHAAHQKLMRMERKAGSASTGFGDGIDSVRR